MTKKCTPSKATSQQRLELLERLWLAHTQKLVEKLEKTPAQELDAATFNSAAKLLSDNGITADVLNKDHAHSGRALAAKARELELEEASEQPGLRTPVPVPALTEENLSALKRLDQS